MIILSVTCEKDDEKEVVTDIDGNVYNIVTIGGQDWMVENLKTTRYSNGEPIDTTDPSTLDITEEVGARYQWAANNNENDVAVYGRLYTWYAAVDNRNICPEGWHVPTDGEWYALAVALDTSALLTADIKREISQTAGGKMKEKGTAHWLSPNYMATNESGFTAVAAGIRINDGRFEGIKFAGHWWSVSEDHVEYNETFAWHYFLIYNGGGLWRATEAGKGGFAVRCVRN